MRTRQKDHLQSTFDPVYPSTEKLDARGLDSKGRRKIIKSVLQKVTEADVVENLPPYLTEKLKLCSRFQALHWIHFHVMGANTTSPRLFEPGDHVLNIDVGLVSGVLPLQWGDIDVISRDDHHAVQWSTLQELNVKEFVVQRRLESEDKFYDIGGVTAVGNSTETEKYEFIDKDVSANGRYFYRLQQIDIDGANSFSSVAQVQRMADLDIKIYPNPASVQIMISGLPDEEGQYFLSLSDELGRLLISREYSYDETVDISDLANGVYTISIVSKGQVIHQDRLIKIE